MPDVASIVAIVTATYNVIHNVKLYRKQCEDLSGRCLNLLTAVEEGSRGLDGTAMIGRIDELSVVVERIQAKISEWSTWSRLKSVVQQGDMKDGIDRLHRELDGCVLKFNIQANIDNHRSHIDLRSIQERDNSNIRELLWTIVKSQDDMRVLLNSQSSPVVVEGVMENLQTQLMAAGLQPREEHEFKAGLWRLHAQTSMLPPLTDLSGQITVLPSKPISGSSNDIYQGEWLDQQKVALRCPRALDDSPATRKRFEREVSSWRQLDHPNVVPLYGFVNIDGKLYSVTPWMDNGNAANYVARFPSVNRMGLLYDIACGLEYLHENKIVHGDVRAHNVLVSQDSVACLSDFGLSKIFEDYDRNLIPSNNASLRWTAPEVLDGSVSAHSDVWSFGMVCLEILSGRVPFYVKDDRGVERQLVNGKHPDRPDFISDEMWDLMLKCWSKDPEVRPSMSGVRESLEEIKSHSNTDDHATGPRSYSSQSPSRRPSLRKITTFFGRKTDDNKRRGSIASRASSSNILPSSPPPGQEPLGQMNGHDWRVIDRSSSTHSYGTVPSVADSPLQTAYPKSSTVANQPSFSPSSKRGSVNNLRNTSQISPTYPPSHSRPSTGNSSLRHWPSAHIPDDDAYPNRRDITGHPGHRGRSHDYPNSVSGQNISTGGTSRPSTRSSLVDAFPNIPASAGHRSTSSDHPNPMSGQTSSIRGAPRPSTMSSLVEMSPSNSNISLALEPPPLGLELLPSLAPRIPGQPAHQRPSTVGVPRDSLLPSATMQPSHQRPSTVGVLGDNALPSPTMPAHRRPGLNYQIAIQDATETPLCILNARFGHVSSGTLEGLVQFLIDGFDSPRHTEYRDVFLMACAEFTTPDGLFQILSRRFKDEEKNRVAERRVVTQYNILMIISYWLKGDYLTPSQELLYRMKFFCEEIAQFKSAGTLLDRANDLHEVVVSEIEKLRRVSPSPSLGGIILQSSQVTPRDLAIGLTLLEGDNYGALHPSDYIMHLSKRQSANIKKLYDINNKIKLWVTESILHFDDVHDRAEVLKFFIHTAVECRTMRNFSSATAIASALHSTAVDNLGVTRKALTRNMQSKLSDLYDIINLESNHRGYREALHDVATVHKNDTCVPWMAFHLKELGKVLRLYPVTIEEDGQHLINFDRYIKFMDRTKEIMYYVPPRLEEFRRRGQLAYVNNRIRGVHPSDDTDDLLMKRSRELMSQEASDYRTRKPQLVKLGFDF